MADIAILSETSDDHAAIRDVTIQAFTTSEFGYGGEAELIEQLRAGCDELVSLVASCQGQIVGHVLFTPVVIQAIDHETYGMGLAPLSVAPQCQNRGIGAQLVKSGLERLAENGYPFVVVLGHPGYYSRLAFEAASTSDVTHGFAGISQDLFMIHIFEAHERRSTISGRAYYRSEFGPQFKSP